MKVIETSATARHQLVERTDREVPDGSPRVRITVDPNERMQTFLGFGGAFTEASAYALSFLTPELRQQVIEDYFDDERGHGYRIGRLTIHSCDFSCESYTYLNDRTDRELKSFSVARDEVLVLPLVRDAQAVAGPGLQFFASPWSPPSFMKTNNIMCFGGELRPEYAGMWADYMVRFLQEYADRGIRCFGVTTQNEPEAVQTWESCSYTGEQERDFIRDHLGPALEASGLGTQVILYDHNRDHVHDRAAIAMADPEAARHLWGTGIHWYMVEDFQNTHKVHDDWPDKHLIFTEGCCAWSTPEGDWESAELYAHNIINDLNTWVEAWTDWNLVLDERGGPNHVENYCAAPVIVDTAAGTVFHQPSFYAIGQFSRFIRPGSVRVGHRIEGNVPSVAEHAPPGVWADEPGREVTVGPALEVTTWQTEAGMVAVVLNKSDDEVTYSIDLGQGPHTVAVPPHAIQTLVA